MDLFSLLTIKVKEQGITSYILQQKLEMETLDRINCELFQYIKDDTNFVFRDVNNFIDTYKILMEDQKIMILYSFNEYCFRFFETYNEFGKSVLNKLAEQLDEEDSDYQPTEEDTMILLNDIQDDNNYDEFVTVDLSPEPMDLD